MTSSARDLEHKSVEELHELSNNDIALIEMVSTDETVRTSIIPIFYRKTRSLCENLKNIECRLVAPKINNEL